MLYECRTITFTNKTSTLSVKTWYKKIIIKKLNLKYKVLMDIGQLRQWIHEYIIGVRCYTIICMYYTKCTDMGLKMSIIKTIYLTRGSSFILLFVNLFIFFSFPRDQRSGVQRFWWISFRSFEDFVKL